MLLCYWQLSSLRFPWISCRSDRYCLDDVIITAPVSSSNQESGVFSSLIVTSSGQFWSDWYQIWSEYTEDTWQHCYSTKVFLLFCKCHFLMKISKENRKFQSLPWQPFAIVAMVTHRYGRFFWSRNHRCSKVYHYDCLDHLAMIRKDIFWTVVLSTCKITALCIIWRVPLLRTKPSLLWWLDAFANGAGG